MAFGNGKNAHLVTLASPEKTGTAAVTVTKPDVNIKT